MKQRVVCITQILRKLSCKLRFFIDIFVLSLAQPVESVNDANLDVFFKTRAPDCIV